MREGGHWLDGWKFWAVGAAIVVAGAAVAVPLALRATPRSPASTTASVHRGERGTSPVASTTVTSSTTTTAPSLLAAGAQGTASQVPWAQVGQGWILATWNPAPSTPTASSSATTTLVLLDPAGGRYVLQHWRSPGTLRDWSGDGTHALFVAGSPNGKLLTVTVLDLRTGTQTTFPAPAGTGLWTAQFSKPDGKAVLAGGVPLRRYSLTGTLQFTYPTTFASGGAGSTVAVDHAQIAESPDGTTLALQGSTGLDVVTNTGKFVRYLPYPVGGADCAPARWWQTSNVLLSCQSLWSQPVAGGSATNLTPDASSTTLVDEWALPSGTIGEAGGCGTWLVGLGTGGAVSQLHAPGFNPNDGHDDYVGANGPTAAVLVRGSCTPTGPPADTLYWLDPGSGASTALLGGPATGGSVGSAVAWGGRTVT